MVDGKCKFASNPKFGIRNLESEILTSPHKAPLRGFETALLFLSTIDRPSGASVFRRV